MFAKPLIELFSEGGPVMVAIAGISVLAWYLALRTWWQSRYHLAWLERVNAGARAASPGTHTNPHIQFIVRAQAARLEHVVWAMGAFATMLPLLGLLGTVLGMLSGFEVIQMHGTGQPRLLAGGIGQALMTTQAGLLTAVPVLFFHHVIRNRVRLIRSEMEMLPQTGPTGDKEREQ